MKAPQKIAFDFVIEQLYSRHPQVKPIFGAHGVYIGNKIICILREKESYPNDNGIWIASPTENHESLKELIPALRKIEMFGANAGDWLLIPSENEDFETYANAFCGLVLQGDLRIGKVSKAKFLTK